MKKNKKLPDEIDSIELVKEEKKYVALKTTKILCNKEFKLIEGKEIPTGISLNFINSLINSNLIK